MLREYKKRGLDGKKGEVGRVDPAEILRPRETGLVHAALVVPVHVGVEPSDDLDDRKALGDPVGGQLLEIGGPAQPLGEAHPPGVGQPEERRAVRMFQVAAIGGHAQEAAAQQRVVAGVARDHERAGLPVQVGVARVRADGAIGVLPDLPRGETHAPRLIAGPKRRNGEFLAVRVGDDDVKLDIVERIDVCLAGGVRPFDGAVATGV